MEQEEKKLELSHLLHDGVIFGLSIVVALLLIKTRLLEQVIANTTASHYVGSLISGIFFTSIFSSAPATVALGEIARLNSMWTTAFFGAIGALLGDLFIFKFMRDDIARDLRYLISLIKIEERWLARSHHLQELRFFKYLLTALGALVIASPLPDELGLMIWGVSHVKTRTVAILTFILNFGGILIIGWVAKKL